MLNTTQPVLKLQIGNNISPGTIIQSTGGALKLNLIDNSINQSIGGALKLNFVDNNNNNNNNNVNMNSDFRITADEFKEFEHRQHIYERPSMYAGSDRKIPRKDKLLDLTTLIITEYQVELPEVIDRCYLEVITNAGDNVENSSSHNVHPGKVEINMDRYTISVKNGGVPIPVEMYPSGVYVPEMIFGRLLTSRHYDKKKARTGCGTNGLGAKIANVFSKQFMIEVGDPYHKLKYQQVWNENMTIKEKPIITDYTGEAYVLVVYHLDFARFGYECYPDEAFGIFARHAVELSLTCKVPVIFNGVALSAQDIKDYARYHVGDAVKNSIVHYQWPPGIETILKRGIPYAKNSYAVPTVEICAVDTPDKSICISFANGMSTKDGGIHVETAFKVLSKLVLEAVNEGKSLKRTTTKDKNGKTTKIVKEKKTREKKDKSDIKLTLGDFKKHVSLFISVRVIDPDYNSQSKTQLKSPTPSIKIDPNILCPIMKWRLIDRLYAELEAKHFKALTKSDGKARCSVNVARAEDANNAKSNNSALRLQCQLWLMEGNSAMGYGVKALSLFGDNARDWIGLYPLKGKPLNVMNAPINQIAENQEIQDLKEMLGLRENTNYLLEENFNTLRYGSVCMMADSDVDGLHILGLIINLFNCRYPSLLARGYLKYLRTPTHRVTLNRQTYKFYSNHKFETWLSKLGKSLPKNAVDYFKGLGTSSDAQIADDFSDPKFVQTIYDEVAPNTLKLNFDKKLANDRKNMLANWAPDHNVEDMVEQPISLFMLHVFPNYSIDNLCRSIPKFPDGLKESQRKIIHGSYVKWGAKTGKNEASKFKVAQLQAHVASCTKYHHGENNLGETIISMALDFVGKNNLPYFRQDGQFGTRNMDGKDSAETRYPFTRPQWWWPKIFIKEDMPLLKMIEDEGEECEPEYYLPILPLQLINGAKGIGTGWSADIPNHDPLDVGNWLLTRLDGKTPDAIMPWYRDFTGDIKIGLRTRSKKARLANENNNVPISLNIITSPNNTSENNNEENDNDENNEDEEEEDILGADHIENDIFSTLNEQSMNHGSTKKRSKLSMITTGKFKVLNSKTIVVTELPIGRVTHKYGEWLDKLKQDKIIKDYKNRSKHNTVCFEITGMKDPSIANLRLEKSYGLSNMVLLDTKNRPIKFNTVQEMLETFYNFRLPFYQKRKDNMLAEIQVKIDKANLLVKFIQAVLDKTLKIKNRIDDELFLEMEQMGFPKELLKSEIGNLSKTRQEKLLREVQELIIKRNEIEQLNISQMWKNDIDNFISAYCRHYKCKNIKKPKASITLITPTPSSSKNKMQEPDQPKINIISPISPSSLSKPHINIISSSQSQSQPQIMHPKINIISPQTQLQIPPQIPPQINIINLQNQK